MMRGKTWILWLAFALLTMWSPTSSWIGPTLVVAAPDIYASPIQAGCYIAGPNDCRIHVEPFTINLASGTKLVYFQLLAIPTVGNSRVIYDFRPDLSNPAPLTGSTFTPSLVSQDFAATCGRTYSLGLQGQDTGDSNPFSLGLTGQFTCPSAVP